MHIIARSIVNAFASKHPNTKTSLEAWYQIVSKTQFADFNALRKTFPSADQVKNTAGNVLTVFNIHGNAVRLIAALHYNTQKLYIRAILTHAEYDQERWKK